MFVIFELNSLEMTIDRFCLYNIMLKIKKVGNWVYLCCTVGYKRVRLVIFLKYFMISLRIISKTFVKIGSVVFESISHKHKLHCSFA